MPGFSVQPQTLATPPPPQVSGDLHCPHWSVMPQPLGMVSQFLCSAAHVVGVHGAAPQIFGPPPPHICPGGQLPHAWTFPQLSVSMPHLPWQAFGLGVRPQTCSVPPPPHVSGALHPPHSTVPPHVATRPHLP